MDSNIIEFITQVGTSTKVFTREYLLTRFGLSCNRAFLLQIVACLVWKEKNIFFFATPKWGHIAQHIKELWNKVDKVLGKDGGYERQPIA